jgi:hypothetical protein
MKTLRSRLVLPLAIIALFGAMSSSVFAQSSEPASASSTAKVDINSASEKQLDALPGVGPATAKKIIAGRPYSSVSDLSKAGVSAATIKKIEPLVTAGGGTAAASARAKTKTTATAPSPAPAAAKATAPPSPPPPAAPAKAPAAASASSVKPGADQVWVNLDTGVYHYSNSRYYGKTQNGKYMSEADATKAGYKAARNEKRPQ